MLQTGGLLGDLTVGETVRLIASLYGTEAGRAGALRCMARADLEHLARPPRLQVLGGMSSSG